MEKSDSTIAKKRKRTAVEDTEKKKKKEIEDGEKKNKKVAFATPISSNGETEGFPMEIFVNVNQPSVSGTTWSVILSKSKKDAMIDLEEKLSIYGIKTNDETAHNFRQLRIAPKKGKSIVILGDLI